MTATADQVPVHPVPGLLARTASHVEALREAWLPSLGPRATGQALVEIDRLQSRLVELQARLLTHAEQVEVAAVEGATSTANWLAHHTRQTRQHTHRLTRLAALGSTA